MSPISVSEGLALRELERCWQQACRRSKRAATAYFIVATSFLFGFAKFGYWVPIEQVPLYEIIFWLASTVLTPLLLICFSYYIWKEWRTYKDLAIFTGHPGAVRNAPLRERGALIVEFVRVGRY